MASWSPADLPKTNPPLWDRDPEWRARAVRLIEHYNKCLGRAASTGGFQARMKRQTPAAQEVFFGLECFAKELNVDVTAWIYACHAALAWKRPVSMKVLFNPKYKRVLDGLFPDRIREVVNAKLAADTRDRPVFRPFVDLYPAAELVKRRYLAERKAARCLSAMEITFGFHKDSEVCPDCPLVEECKVATIKARDNR